MKLFALIVAIVVGFVTGFGLEEAGVNVFASINIAVAVVYAWYQLLKTIEITVE